MDWRTVFLSAEGRIGRRDFWTAVLILMVLWAIAPLFHVLAPVIWLVLLYPWVCVFAKRLHDFGRSGWLIVLPFVIGFVAVILGVVFGGFAALSSMWAWAFGGPVSWAAAFAGFSVMMAFLALAGLVKLVFVLWVGLTPGDPGPNLYGPPSEALLPQP